MTNRPSDFSSPQRELIAQVASAALELPAPERQRFVEARCGADAAAASEVLSLLAHARAVEPSGFLGRPLDPSALDGALRDALTPGHVAAPRACAGERIGPYTLVRVLGEGGFGIVYLAEQTAPLRREVAIKVIKPGMDSHAVLGRFEAERQALAVMEHHCIARVLDAGQTERGLPYFVMEYVKGEPITRYCDRQALPIRERLVLFTHVCEAVQHAHMKGVIHRDIKPSNLLVSIGDRGPVVKVIDFGVAKALSPALSRGAAFTEHGQLIGTPEYMSPEQAEMGATDIDTRTDVYSLGVVLYELLTGVLPFSAETLRRAGLDEIRRIIREVEPPKPSTRFIGLAEASAEAARMRQASRDELASALRRELDWIPLKAMRKDRTQRYRTPSDLADDVRSYLAGRPLAAGPESAAYHVRKFVRRHRAAVAASAAIVGLLLAGIGGTGWGLAQALAAEAQARRRAGELEQLARFQSEQLGALDAAAMGLSLRRGLREKLIAADARRSPGEAELQPAVSGFDEIVAGADFTGLALDVLEEHVFSRSLRAISLELGDQPVLRARMLQTMADMMREAGLLDAAAPAQLEAMDIRRRELGDAHPDTLASINSAAALCSLQGRYPEADRLVREALTGRRSVLGGDHPDTLTSLNDLGILLQRQGMVADAEGCLREALSGRRRVLGDEHPQTLGSIGDLAAACRARGDFGAAEPLYLEALEARRRVLGPDHPDTLISASNMGVLLQSQGRLDEAEPYLRDALERRRRVLGDEHPDTLASINNLGALLRSQGELDEASACLREALRTSRLVLGDEHPATLISIINMGTMLRSQGRFDEAVPFLGEALGASRRVHGGSHPTTLAALNNMGALMRDLGRPDEANAFGAEAVAGARRALPAGHWHLGVFLLEHGGTLRAMGRLDEAEEALLEAQTLLEAALGPSHERTVAAVRQLGELYAARHAAEPGRGYDAIAGGWLARLNNSEPTDGP